MSISDYGRSEEEIGDVKRWTTKELGEDFIVHDFAAPFVLATRKSDKALGHLEFCHEPRFYFNWIEEGKGGGLVDVGDDGTVTMRLGEKSEWANKKEE